MTILKSVYTLLVCLFVGLFLSNKRLKTIEGFPEKMRKFSVAFRKLFGKNSHFFAKIKWKMLIVPLRLNWIKLPLLYSLIQADISTCRNCFWIYLSCRHLQNIECRHWIYSFFSFIFAYIATCRVSTFFRKNKVKNANCSLETKLNKATPAL